jgi:hypothetical protein
MRKLIYVLILVMICLTGSLMLNGNFPGLGSRQAITWFPDNKQIIFTKAETRLNAVPQSRQMNWAVDSELREKVYLVQQFSMLYQNNRLIGTINHWKRNEQSLTDLRTLTAVPGFYQSLTVHQGELHSDEKIFGKEILSEDQLFLYQEGAVLQAVSRPTGSYLKQLNEQQKHLISQAQKQYHFLTDNYRVLPLSELTEKNMDQLFPFGADKAQRIAGRLWEGIYRMMVRGIETPQGFTIPAAGSSMPILLVGNDHLLVIIEAADHQIALLKQQF